MKDNASRSAEDEPSSSNPTKGPVRSTAVSANNQFTRQEHPTLAPPSSNMIFSESALLNRHGSRYLPPMLRRVNPTSDTIAKHPTRSEPSCSYSARPSDIDCHSSSQDLSIIIGMLSSLDTKVENYKKQVLLSFKARLTFLEKKLEYFGERAKEDSVQLTKVLENMSFINASTNIESAMQYTRSDLACVLEEVKDYMRGAAVLITKDSLCDNLRGVNCEEELSRKFHPLNQSVPTKLPGTSGSQPSTSGSGSLDLTSPRSESKWELPGVAITVRRFGEGPQLGVIRESMLDGKFQVALGASGDGDIVVVKHSEMELVMPKKTDHIKIVSGRLQNNTGKLIGIDGTNGIVKMDDSLGIKSLDMSNLVKMVALQPVMGGFRGSETITFGGLEPQLLNGMHPWHEPLVFTTK